ncbi:uncharacterized protein LOC142804276 isoform X2 [Rhipicephalus microplus]|uniref:uncharacterized protein LOC142804276 isoform X2 n=1 Tax=Rhipicephalus microplus TaxID=6941 RepID=UPI003F6B225E
MDILAHALRELNSSRLPAFCAKFKVSFSAGSANDTGDDSRLDDSRRGPCVVIEHVMEEKVSHPFKDPLSAVGDCLFRSSARKKSDSRTNSLVLSTARRLCRRGLAASPYAEGHLAAQASPLKGFPDKANFDKRTDAQHGEPLHLDPAGTSGSCEESVGNRESLCSHRNYVLHSQAAFETYWKGNLHNIHEVLKELTESGTSELGWKRQGKLHEFTKVDVHLLRTAILHREIMECELQKVLRTADRELTSTCFCLHDIFVKEGIGYWLAEHLDLIWSEFGNQVQKGVVNLHKAFDSPYVRAWASTVDTNTDEVALNIHSLWMAFIGRVQESRRHVVEEETTLQDDMDNSFLPQRIYTYTRILRRYEELANHDWQVTYRSTIAVLDQALSGGAVRGLGASCLSVVPVAHTKVMVIVTKIWEEVMVEIRQAFKECREKFEEAILVDHGL